MAQQIKDAWSAPQRRVAARQYRAAAVTPRRRPVEMIEQTRAGHMSQQQVHEIKPADRFGLENDGKKLHVEGEAEQRRQLQAAVPRARPQQTLQAEKSHAGDQ